MSAEQEAELNSDGRTSVLATSVLVVFLLAMTVTIANVSLPQMQGSLSATRDQVAWVVTSFLVPAPLPLASARE